MADAYQGRQIKQATVDFLDAASGTTHDTVTVQKNKKSVILNVYGGA